MATNKVALRTIIEFMQGYVPAYQPIYPFFMGKSQAYSEEVGKIDFRRVNTVGDIRAKHITPKNTEIRQLSVNEQSKIFKKYFLANQFTMSALQDQQGVEDVVAQVLDEHQKQADELLLLGEGSSNSTMINNGLFWSNDPNYVLENSTAIDKDADPLVDLHTKVMADATQADLISGKKLLIFYGDVIIPKFDGIYQSQPVPFKRVLSEVLGPNYNVIKMPVPVTPSGESGWIIANLDQVKLHYTTMPKLADQGVNDEKMYAWFNFLMGSSMLEVLASGAVIRRPATNET